MQLSKRETRPHIARLPFPEIGDTRTKFMSPFSQDDTHVIRARLPFSSPEIEQLQDSV
jgi:hypothetical protein